MGRSVDVLALSCCSGNTPSPQPGSNDETKPNNDDPELFQRTIMSPHLLAHRRLGNSRFYTSSVWHSLCGYHALERTVERALFGRIRRKRVNKGANVAS